MQRKLSVRGLPEALLEAGLIVFAVLVALGVDEYWETREERTLAETALERVASEVLANRADLLSKRDNNRKLMTDLGVALTRLEAGEELGLSDVNYDVSLLGSDAWQTAQVTRAVHFIDFDQVGRISKVYRVQQFYLDRQAPIVEVMAALGGEDEVRDAFRSIRRGLKVTLEVGCDLLAEYDALLDDLTTGQMPGKPLPDECG